LSAVAGAVKTALSVVQTPEPARELVIGKLRTKLLGRSGQTSYQAPTYLDAWSPGLLDYRDSFFDEIHAYHMLQQIGVAGDTKAFFGVFIDIWRVLKPGGHLYATVPSPCSDWLWGDPGNVRAITPATITFLQQPQYDKQVGVTAMTDYRHLYRCDFEPELLQDDTRELRIILRAIKPSRCTK
jgi:hypothetical protein